MKGLIRNKVNRCRVGALDHEIGPVYAIRPTHRRLIVDQWIGFRPFPYITEFNTYLLYVKAQIKTFADIATGIIQV